MAGVAGFYRLPAAKIGMAEKGGLFVCNHIAFGRLWPWHIYNIFPPCFSCNKMKQKQSCKPH